MILRNFTMSTERRQLVSPVNPPLSAVSSVLRAAHPDIAPAGDRPPLDVEAVIAWLCEQSIETRASCARTLVDDLEVVRASARAEGIEQGRLQGLREEGERAHTTLDSLASIATAAERAFELERTQLAEGCVAVVAEAFQKLAGAELVRPEAVLGVVLEVLARLKDQRELTILVNAQDLPQLEAAEPQLAAALGTRRWTITADPRISLGGCLVESTLGTLDGRLEVQLRELYRTLSAANAERSEGA